MPPPKFNLEWRSYHSTLHSYCQLMPAFRSLLHWVVMQGVLVFVYRRFEVVRCGIVVWDSPSPLPASFLLPLNLNLFQTPPSLFYVVFLFSLFLSLYRCWFFFNSFVCNFFNMNILVRRILYVLQYLPLVICPLYPCLYSFSSVRLLL